MVEFIQSGFASLDKLMGGGLQPGYPWLLVASAEAEGTAVTVASVTGWRVVAQGYPTLIMTSRHPWGVSIERYKQIMPKIYANLKQAAEQEKLSVVNLASSPGYKPTLNYERSLPPRYYPTQVCDEIMGRLDAMKTGGKPVFWRLSSINDVMREWGAGKTVDVFKRLLPLLHGKGAVGVATINREITPRQTLGQMESLFMNVAYVDAKLKPKTRYTIQIVKAYNPKSSTKVRELRVTPKYEIAIV